MGFFDPLLRLLADERPLDYDHPSRLGWREGESPRNRRRRMLLTRHRRLRKWLASSTPAGRPDRRGDAMALDYDAAVCKLFRTSAVVTTAAVAKTAGISEYAARQLSSEESA